MCRNSWSHRQVWSRIQSLLTLGLHWIILMVHSFIFRWFLILYSISLTSTKIKLLNLYWYDWEAAHPKDSAAAEWFHLIIYCHMIHFLWIELLFNQLMMMTILAAQQNKPKATQQIAGNASCWQEEGTTRVTLGQEINRCPGCNLLSNIMKMYSVSHW